MSRQNRFTFENDNSSTTGLGANIAAIYDDNKKLKTMSTLSVPDAEFNQDPDGCREQRRKRLNSHSFRVNWQIMSSSFNSDMPGRAIDDNDEDGDRSDFSGSEYPKQQPTRSYRCTTNMATLQQLNTKLAEDLKKNADVQDNSVFSYKNNLSSSLFIFSEDNCIRRICIKITSNKIFDYFILLTIVANCIVLMASTPLPSNDTSELNKKLDQSDVVFVAIFLLEVVLRVIANGLILGPFAYLNSGWNILDFIVAISGTVHILTTIGPSSGSKQTEFIKALRAVRVLRPLKLVSGVPSLQVLLKSLVRAMIPLLQILLLVLFVIIIYSIVGLELLRGRFHFACFNATTDELIVPISILKLRPCDYTGGGGRKCGDGEICRRAKPHEWAGPKDGITTFDNMFLSMLTIFQCITLEGWSDILYLSMDSRDKDFPIINWFAFILLIIVGSFFMLNLVLGVLSGEFAKERERVENRKSFFKLRKLRAMERQVDHYLNWIAKAEEIIDEFNEDEEMEYEGQNDSKNPNGKSDRHNNHLDYHQHKYHVSRKRSRPINPKRTKGNFLKKLEKKFRVCIRHLIKSKVFYWLVLILVFLNTVAMSLTAYDQLIEMKQILDLLELIFTVLFLVEMILRMYGLGMRGYFHSAFNKYDFVVVWLSIGDLIFTRIFNTSSIGISVLRSVRLLRVFKVTRFWSSMQNVVSSLLNSMRSILSLILLLLLFILIFALLGMQLFGGQ